MTIVERMRSRSGLATRSGLASRPGPASSSGLTSRRHVDYGRVRSAICPAG